MKFLFIVQGEGRGHMTQAISFSNMLRKEGHELSAVIVGKSKRRKIPEFFSKQIQAPIHSVESPNFVTDKEEKQVLIGKTIVQNLQKVSLFLKSLKQIHQVVKEHKPEVILNFYDLLGGIYNFTYRPKARFWAIGHQYLSKHPDFPFAESKGFAKECFQINTWLTALGAEKKLALSFRRLASPIHTDIIVVPPLLRAEVKSLSTSNEGFYLAYMVNTGYAKEVISFAKKNPSLKIKAYWDKKDAAETEQPLPNLTLHQVNDQGFLKDMAACKGLVCTAGFESICEAMYLGKPVMVIPVKGQYEQACNALDTLKSGVGITSNNFDFGLLEEEIKNAYERPNYSHNWCNSWPSILMEILPKKEMTEPDMLLAQSLS